MSEVEKKLEGVLTEYAKMDDGLRDMYVRLRELDSISDSYNKTNRSLESSSANLKATSEALIAEIEILRDLASKLGKSQITTFNDKLDSLSINMNEKLNGSAYKMNEKLNSFEANLMKQQELLEKNRMICSAILGLVSLAVCVALYSVLR